MRAIELQYYSGVDLIQVYDDGNSFQEDGEDIIAIALAKIDRRFLLIDLKRFCSLSVNTCAFAAKIEYQWIHHYGGVFISF